MSNLNFIEAKKVVLKKITKSDLSKVARVHIDSFPASALTKLGPQIVQRYYFWQLTGPHKKVYAVGAFIGKDCVGFSFSGEFNGSISGFIDNNKFFLGREILFRPWLLLNPLFLNRIFSGVRILKKFYKTGKKSGAHKTKEPSFGILSIAVASDRQKLGIGQILMKDAENEACRCGYRQMHLTVSTENEKAIRFYEKLGWEKRLSDGAWKGSMTKTLN